MKLTKVYQGRADRRAYQVSVVIRKLGIKGSQIGWQVRELRFERDLAGVSSTVDRSCRWNSNYTRQHNYRM